jgi:hypothetical protein
MNRTLRSSEAMEFQILADNNIPLYKDCCRMTRALAKVISHRGKVEASMPEYSAAFKARGVKRLMGPPLGAA